MKPPDTLRPGEKPLPVTGDSSDGQLRSVRPASTPRQANALSGNDRSEPAPLASLWRCATVSDSPPSRLQSGRERGLNVFRQGGDALDNPRATIAPMHRESPRHRPGRLVHGEVKYNLGSALDERECCANLDRWSKLSYGNKNHLLVARACLGHSVLNEPGRVFGQTPNRNRSEAPRLREELAQPIRCCGFPVRDILLIRPPLRCPEDHCGGLTLTDRALR